MIAMTPPSQLNTATKGIATDCVPNCVLVPNKMDENVNTQSNYGVFALTTVTFFLAEMGDKTQIIALAPSEQNTTPSAR
jgi:Ca2+/H+ antiporter, TMEM165/GDT1 family